jgi:hypothetical protein
VVVGKPDIARHKDTRFSQRFHETVVVADAAERQDRSPDLIHAFAGD